MLESVKEERDLGIVVTEVKGISKKLPNSFS